MPDVILQPHFEEFGFSLGQRVMVARMKIDAPLDALMAEAYRKDGFNEGNI